MPPYLRDMVTEAFGELVDFKDAFIEAALRQFASGWVWLIAQSGGALAIETTANADNPLIWDVVPLLACDLWEHAYYLDYQNRRADYVRCYLDHLVNWDFAAENLARLSKQLSPGERVTD